jgi:hypothetical protein
MNPRLHSNADSGLPRIKERRIFAELKKLDSFCADHSIPYAVFGGVGTAAFVGQFVRPVHDVDFVVAGPEAAIVREFLFTQRFRSEPTESSGYAGFERLSKSTESGELVFQLFPGKFTLLDLAHGSWQPLWVYNFADALERAKSRFVWNLDRSEKLHLRVVPLEDLIVSKLWPFFESNMVYDLVFLLRFALPKCKLDEHYLMSRLENASPVMKQQCVENLGRFDHTVQHTVLLNALSHKPLLKQSVKALKQSFARSLNGKTANYAYDGTTD